MADIRSFITDNEDGDVQVSPGVSYSLKQVINESYRLYNAKFQSEQDSGDMTKIFYRMIWIIYRTIIMSSDIDMKDMNLRSMNGKGIRLLALLKVAVRSHLLKTFFGKYVDSVMSQMVWFGSSLTKRVDGKLALVDLRNYVTQPNIKDPQNRSHAEYCYYTWDQMCSYKEQWKENWSTIEDLWKKMQEEGESIFNVIEFWTWDTMKGKTHKVCVKYLDINILEPDTVREPSEWNPYLELDKFITPYKRPQTSKRMREGLGEDEEELFPYEQADFFDAPGRWLGFGCAELLAGIQEHYNEHFNLKRKKDILDLRGIFVHKYTNTANSLTQEFLDNLETGSVVQMDVNEDLQRLIIDTKTAEFISNVDKLYELMRMIMGITAAGTGEELPGNTSATGVRYNYATQQTTYDFVRERMHHFLTQLFQDGYFEDIIDELTKEQMVAIVSSPKELIEFDKALAKNYVTARSESRYNQLEQTKLGEDGEGEEVSYEEVQTLQALEDEEYKFIMEELKKLGDTRWVELKKELIDWLEYNVEFYVTNEQFDKVAKIQTLQQMLVDPNFTGSRKAVEDAIFDLVNENPRQFDKSEEERAMELKIAEENMMLENKVNAGPAPIGVNAIQPIPEPAPIQ